MKIFQYDKTERKAFNTSFGVNCSFSTRSILYCGFSNFDYCSRNLSFYNASKKSIFDYENRKFFWL